MGGFWVGVGGVGECFLSFGSKCPSILYIPSTKGATYHGIEGSCVVIGGFRKMSTSSVTRPLQLVFFATSVQPTRSCIGEALGTLDTQLITSNRQISAARGGTTKGMNML